MAQNFLPLKTTNLQLSAYHIKVLMCLYCVMLNATYGCHPCCISRADKQWGMYIGGTRSPTANLFESGLVVLHNKLVHFKNRETNRDDNKAHNHTHDQDHNGFE